MTQVSFVKADIAAEDEKSSQIKMCYILIAFKVLMPPQKNNIIQTKNKQKQTKVFYLLSLQNELGLT
jgi:hypothetical protein